MSIFHRRRIMIDGDRWTQTHHFFRCRQCDRTVKISSSSFNPHNSICPLCYAQSTQEPLSHHFPTHNVVPSDDHTPSDHDPTAGNDRTVVLRVTRNMLTREPHCAICKQEFKVNEEISALPCTHFYHSTCVLPWLQIHNTCPVCRFQLPVRPAGPRNYNNNTGFENSNFNNISDDNYDEFRFDDVYSMSWPSWSEILSLWPLNITTFRRLFNATMGNYETSQSDGLIDDWS